jgi:ABC-type multidrug transport system fused ATPase/permease subunit
MLVLDDVLSAVDHKTEHQLIQSLLKLREERQEKGIRPSTILIVSHRLSVLSETDRILVLEEGSLLHEGSHKELLNTEGPYREAWLQQQEEGKETSSTEEGQSHD